MKTPNIQKIDPVLASPAPRLFTAIILTALFFIAACGEKKMQTPMREAAPVVTAVAVIKDMPVLVRAFGNVEAYSTVSVKSLVAGELQEVHFKEGQEVKRGDLLFTIDPRPLEAEVRRLEAGLARDSSQLNVTEANLARDIAQAKNAENQSLRYKSLFEKGVAAKEQYDQMLTSFEAYDAAVRADRAAVQNARDTVRASRASLDNARIQLGYCTIRSPIDGRTGSLQVYRGNIVKANDTPALVVINQVSPIYVTFSMPEQYLNEIRKRMPAGNIKVRAVLPGGDEPAAEGMLSFVDNLVDVNTGTIKLKAVFTNADRRLWPGLYVDVSMLLGSQTNAVVVPSEAVMTGQSGPYVFVVQKDSTVDLRPVTPGRSVSGETIIEKGLQGGETAVTDGQLGLVRGTRVQIKEPAPKK